MKYLVVVLILIASLAAHAPAEAPEPLHTYAAAAFMNSASGVETTVEVSVRQTSSPLRVGLSIHRTTRSCDGNACQQVPVISGYTYQDVRPPGALIDRALNRAFVHTMIRFHDDVTNTYIPVRVDVTWTAAGPAAVCDVKYDQEGCVRVATVLGDVASGPLRLIPGQTVPDGRIERSLPRSYIGR